jgi:hypothetical protein
MEVTRTAVNGNHLQCGKYEFEPVKELSYLGSQLNQTNSTNCEILARIISGNRCHYSCGALMESRALNRSLKLKTYTGYSRNNSHFWRRHCSGCGGDAVMGVVSLVSCGPAIFR